MQRTAISMALVLSVLLSLFATAPIQLAAQESTPTPTLFSAPPTELCTAAEYSGWETVPETPPGKEEWEVLPLDQPTEPPERILYLVVITLGPGKCIPYASPANQKNGAIVLVVQSGEIEFTAQASTDAPTAKVYFGDPDGPGENPGTSFMFGTTKHVGPNQWVSQDDRVWFTYKNPSTVDDAVIWKVVWADRVPDEGCGGDCK
jgi:hypothetical protein